MDDSRSHTPTKSININIANQTVSYVLHVTKRLAQYTSREWVINAINSTQNKEWSLNLEVNTCQVLK